MEPSNRSYQQLNVLDQLFDVLVQHHIQESERDRREQLEAIRANRDSILAGESASDILGLEVLDFAYHELDQDAFERVMRPKSKPGSENESQKRKKPEPPVDYQVGETIGDIRFALFNLFKDLYQIHQHIDELLEKYILGDVGFVLIGTVINLAIGIVRSIETKFLESLPQPRFSSWEDVMSVIASPPHFQAIAKDLSEGPELKFLYSIYGLPFQQLQQFRDCLKAETVPSYALDQVDDLDLKPSFKGSRLRQMTVLNGYLQEVALVGGGETLAFDDELTRGIIDICEGAGSFKNKADTVHLWIVFGLQLFLDTQEQLGNCLCSYFVLPGLLLEQVQPSNYLTRQSQQPLMSIILATYSIPQT